MFLQEYCIQLDRIALLDDLKFTQALKSQTGLAYLYQNTILQQGRKARRNLAEFTDLIRPNLLLTLRLLKVLDQETLSAFATFRESKLIHTLGFNETSKLQHLHLILRQLLGDLNPNIDAQNTLTSFVQRIGENPALIHDLLPERSSLVQEQFDTFAFLNRRLWLSVFGPSAVAREFVRYLQGQPYNRLPIPDLFLVSPTPASALTPEEAMLLEHHGLSFSKIANMITTIRNQLNDTGGLIHFDTPSHGTDGLYYMQDGVIDSELLNVVAMNTAVEMKVYHTLEPHNLCLKTRKKARPNLKMMYPLHYQDIRNSLSPVSRSVAALNKNDNPVLLSQITMGLAGIDTTIRNMEKLLGKYSITMYENFFDNFSEDDEQVLHTIRLGHPDDFANLLRDNIREGMTKADVRRAMTMLRRTLASIDFHNLYQIALDGRYIEPADVLKGTKTNLLVSIRHRIRSSLGQDTPTFSVMTSSGLQNLVITHSTFGQPTWYNGYLVFGPRHAQAGNELVTLSEECIRSIGGIIITSPDEFSKITNIVKFRSLDEIAEFYTQEGKRLAQVSARLNSLISEGLFARRDLRYGLASMVGGGSIHYSLHAYGNYCSKRLMSYSKLRWQVGGFDSILLDYSKHNTRVANNGRYVRVDPLLGDLYEVMRKTMIGGFVLTGSVKKGNHMPRMVEVNLRDGSHIASYQSRSDHTLSSLFGRAGLSPKSKQDYLKSSELHIIEQVLQANQKTPLLHSLATSGQADVAVKLYLHRRLSSFDNPLDRQIQVDGRSPHLKSLQEKEIRLLRKLPHSDYFSPAGVRHRFDLPSFATGRKITIAHDRRKKTLKLESSVVSRPQDLYAVFEDKSKVSGPHFTHIFKKGLFSSDNIRKQRGKKSSERYSALLSHYDSFLKYMDSIHMFVADITYDNWQKLVREYIGFPHPCFDNFEHLNVDTTSFRISKEYHDNPFVKLLIPENQFKFSDIHTGRIQHVFRDATPENLMLLTTYIAYTTRAMLNNSIDPEENATMWRQTPVMSGKDRTTLAESTKIRGNCLYQDEDTIFQLLGTQFLAPQTVLYRDRLIRKRIHNAQITTNTNRIFSGMTPVLIKGSRNYQAITTLHAEVQQVTSFQQLSNLIHKLGDEILLHF